MSANELRGPNLTCRTGKSLITRTAPKGGGGSFRRTTLRVPATRIGAIVKGERSVAAF